MLSHGGAADTIWTQTTRRNLVEVLSPASVYLKGAVEWIHTNDGSDKIAVLHESDAFSTLASNSAISYAESLGLSVVYNQSYPTGATDLSPQLNAAMAQGADDLLGGGHFNDGLLIMNQLKTIWTPKFVSLLVAQAIGRANSLNTTDVRAALGNMHIMNFFGQFQIASSGLQIAHTMILVQWQAGALKVVYPADVAQASVQYPYTGS